jgi:long-chain acyl-CoA synthetase
MTVEHEASTSPRYLPIGAENTTDDIVHNAVRTPDRPAFASRVAGVWRTKTWREFAEQTTAVAAGLVANGVAPGDRVAIMAGTCLDWVRADYAIWLAGAVTVPIYETSSAAQTSWILRDSGAVAAFVADERRRVLVAGAGTVRHVWSMADGALAELAADARDDLLAEVEHRRRTLTPDSLATIVYTSGTTGNPKGCELTHGNLLASVHSVTMADGVEDEVLNQDTSILLFLPLAHIFARIVQLAAVHAGALTAHTDDIAGVADQLAAFRPTLVLAVPRVFEKFHDRAARAAATAGHRRLFRAAERTAVAYSRAIDAGRPGLPLRARRFLFDRLVYPKLRAALGGRVRYAVSGGAPLSPTLGHFLRGIGIPVLEGYGLTETSAAVTVNLPAAQRIGTVGRPLPGCRVRIAADSEVLVRGGSVFGGYWGDERATVAAFDGDGWLRTGDLGRLDDGYLTIIGRKKELLVTSSGKNIAPAFLEERVRAHELVDECVLVGDNRPYVAALVTLDPDAVAAWQREHGTGTDADVRSAVQAIIDDANAAVSTAESVRRFRILPTPFAVNDELTPTQKVRRGHVLAKYAGEIAELYVS